MMIKYKTIYEDKHGIERTEFHSDGSELKIKLREIEFEGICFETLEGEINKGKFEYIEYNNNNNLGDLINCNFKLEIPIKLVHDKKEILKTISADIQLGKSKNNGVILTLRINQNSISNLNRHGFFEDALIEIQNHLPKKYKIKTCLSCKFSHYNPYGNGMFGYLYCFKRVKKETKRIVSKDKLFEVWELAEKEDKLFNVQETFDCNEHQFITKNDWNYSNWE